MNLDRSSYPPAQATQRYELRCIRCKTVNDERATTTYCTECGSVLRIYYQDSVHGLTFPLQTLPPDPLRKRETELYKLEALSLRYKAELYGKMEFQNPTGCFKDRGSFIEVLKARELGAKAIALASTGNMAASVAAYAAVFKIPCYVFVPEITSEGKLAQAMIYGAHILKIKGDYSTCEALCRKVSARMGFYLAGDYVFREEGQKSASFEIALQQPFDFDYVLIPVGCGTNFGALHKGFMEAQASGLLHRIPHLVAVQPEQSSPVIEGLAKGAKIVKERVVTNAGAVAAADPIDFYKVLEGVQATKGMGLTVSENELLEALREMALTEGIFTEPACALPLAAVKKYPDHFTGKRCLLILTGTGLKDTGVVTRNALVSPVLPPDPEQILDFIASGYLDLQQERWGKPKDTSAKPLNLDREHRRLYEQYLEQINRKGKELTPYESEVLQQLVLQEQIGLSIPFKVLDYDIQVRKNSLVVASITFQLDDGAIIQHEASGVGPVDAVLRCAKRLTDLHLPLQLVYHRVEVLSPDSRSLVVVSMKLSYADQFVEVKAASPDTIEAALYAFIKGLAIALDSQKKV